MRIFLCLFAAQSLLSCQVSAAPVDDLMRDSANNGKYTYVMFYRANDLATRRMAATVSEQVSNTPEKTSWVQVNVTDRSAAGIVQKYDAGRLPMPTVMGIAPNGAITCVSQLKVSPQQLDNAILTPRYSEMVRNLQQQKIAVVCLQPASGKFLPSGVTQLQANSNLKNHIVTVSASADDASEAKFFDRMRVETNIQEPVVLMFAPPGVFLGRFDAHVSGQQLATVIHKSGKCSCKGCQHKHK